MPKIVTTDEFSQRLHNLQLNVKLLSSFEGSRNKVKVMHKVCGTIWEPYAYNLLRGKGCPVCGKQRGDCNQRNIYDKTFSLTLRKLLPSMKLTSEYLGRNTLVTLKDKKTGQVLQDYPRNLVRKQEVREKASRLKFSSLVNAYVRGYEPQAIEYITRHLLAKAKDLEVTGIASVKYRYKGRLRNYRPDIYVKSQRRIVEVKSIATLGLLRPYYYKTGDELIEQLKAKRLGCMSAGFKFTLLVMERDGERVLFPKNWYNLSSKEIVRQLG